MLSFLLRQRVKPQHVNVEIIVQQFDVDQVKKIPAVCDIFRNLGVFYIDLPSFDHKVHFDVTNCTTKSTKKIIFGNILLFQSLLTRNSTFH